MIKTNALRSFWIIACSMGVTLRYSLAVLLRALFNNATREKVDRILHQWSRQLLSYPKVQLNVSQETSELFNSPGRYIIMSNHSSLYDIPTIFQSFPQATIRMVAKKELSTVPIWSRAMHAAEFVFIDRQNRKQAIEDLERAKIKMESGIVLWMSPEGTRSRSGELLPFKKGGVMLAIAAKAVIIPVGIKGTFDILPPKTLHFSMQKDVSVNVGAPIDASQYTSRDRDQLRDHLHETIEKLLQS